MSVHRIVRSTSPSAEVAVTQPVLQGVVLSSVDKIIKLEAQVGRDQWELAELYANELAKDGMTTRKLANLVGKSHVHVSYMAKAWSVNQVNKDLPFQEAYALAKAPVKPRAIASSAEQEPEEPVKLLNTGNLARAARRSAQDTSRPEKVTVYDDFEAQTTKRLYSYIEYTAPYEARREWAAMLQDAMQNGW